MKVWFLIAKVILWVFLALFLAWLALASASSHNVPASTYLWINLRILFLVVALIILHFWEKHQARKQ